MSDHWLEPICYGCEHCGCNPNAPDDHCWVCEECDDEYDEDAADEWWWS